MGEQSKQRAQFKQRALVVTVEAQCFAGARADKELSDAWKQVLVRGIGSMIDSAEEGDVPLMVRLRDEEGDSVIFKS